MLFRLLFMLCVMVFPKLSSATHISGADMSYTWISGNTFKLKLTLYRDCSGIAAPNSVSVSYKSVSCGYNLNVTLTKVPGTGQEITQPCDNSATVCTGGTSPGFQKYDYTANVTLPAQCTDWVFGYAICCRNCAITTLTYTPSNCTGVPATYVEATLNNLAAPTNSSPVFTNVPVAFFCIGQTFHYNHGAFDADGDSLVYSFVTPRSAATTNVVFAPGYSMTQPITSSPPISLAQSGDIVINPTAMEVGVMAILVKEYRNGVLISTVVRDMEVWTTTCSNSLPSATGINGTNIFNLTSCPGQPITININSADVDASQIVSMEWNFGIPGATFTSNSSSRPVGTFTWTPTLAQARSQPYTFTVTVQDNNCPSTGFQTYSYSINVPELTTSTTVVNSNCSSPGTGSVTVNPAGDPPFTYVWNTGAATSSLTNLLAGTYTVDITDANGCSISTSGTVNAPSPVDASIISTTNAGCYGSNNGAASSSVSGGVSPYTYTWSPSGGTSAAASSLTAGTYTMTATDSHGCTKSATAVITQPSILVASASGSALLCHGDANGVVNVSPSGGTAPYSYAWMPSGSTTSNATGLSTGTYMVVVTDLNGCTISKTANVTQPSAINISVSSTPAFCGTSNGTASSTTSGGTAPYTYSWSPGGGTTPTITNLAAAGYTITATDFHGCTETNSVGVSNMNGPIVNVLSKTNVKCNGGNDGAATVAVTGGQAPFTYSWSPSGATTATATGLMDGNQVVTVTDGNNCVSSISLQINEPSALTASISSTNPLCNGGNTGSATVSVAGGTSGYTYTWTPGNAHTTSIGTLTASTYTVLVTDANSCTKSVSATLTQPIALTGIVTAVNNVSCFGGGNGSSSVSPAGGTSPYTYSWFPSGGSSQSAAGMVAGSYTMKITDAHGCTKNVPVNITQPTLLSSSIISSGNVLCNGGNTGFANSSVTGGSSPYTYNWSTGTTLASATTLTHGTYFVTITDSHGCTSASTVTITEPTPVLGSVLAQGDVLCNSGHDGTATVNGSGGTTPYTYSWSPAGGTSATANNLVSSNYTVTVNDANHCSTSVSLVIDEPSPVTASISSINANCHGNADGSALVIPAGGTNPYDYLWSNGGGTLQSAGGLTSGNYSVRITDSHSCTITTSVTVNEPASISSTVATTNSTCGNSNGSADVTTGGGTPPYIYSWSGNSSTASSITNVSAGAYTATITDDNGCTSAITAGVSNTGAPAITLNSTSNVSCAGGNNGAAAISVSGGTPPFAYLWTPGNATTQSVNNFHAGNYSVKVTDANNCISVMPLSISEPAALEVEMFSTPVSCAGGNNGAVWSTAGGGTGNYSYSWNASVDTSSSRNNLPAGTYAVVITDQNGCTITNQGIITQPQLLVATINSSSPVSCYGGSNGTASVAVNGGTSPFQYQWNIPALTSSIATGIPAGNYLATVTDGNGCTSLAAITISQPPVLVLQSSSAEGTCGFNNGSALATASGGTAPYTYNWIHSGETTSSVSGLTTGNYSVVTTDTKGCTATSQTTVTNTGAVRATLSTVNNVSCAGGSDGSASVNATGGTTPYIYDWNTGGNSSSVSGLGAGTYNVLVTDLNNCTSTVNITVTEPAALASSMQSTPVTCSGAANGGASAIITGGVPPYNYDWLPGGISNSSIAGLSGGIYSVSVSDAHGCTLTTQILIDEPPQIASTTRTSPAGCNLSNGSAIVEVTGGTPPFNYRWTPGTLMNDTAEGIAAGSYQITVTDANNCSLSAAVSVSNTNGPVASLLSASDAKCKGASDGTAEVSVSGGGGSYIYNWFPSGGNNAVASGLSAGSYSVNIRDINNCITAIPVTISEPAAISSVINSSAVNCFGGNDGAANIIANGGTTPYNYLWSNGDTSANAAALSEGIYSVIVSDAHNCTASYTSLINQPTIMEVNFSSVDVSCNGGSDGHAVVTVSGGSSGYSYLWSTGSELNDASSLAAGNYSVTINDSHNCTIDSSVTINEPSLLIPTTTATDVSCPGLTDGITNASVSGGTPPYSYSWSQGGGNNISATNLATGVYLVTVKDAHNCIQSETAIVGAPQPVTYSTTAVAAKCAGSSDGSASVSVNGGIPPYTYFWNNGSITANASNLSQGIYTVMISDAHHCTTQTTATVDQPSALELSVQQSPVICIGQQAQLSSVCNGGTQPYSYTWNNGNQSGSQSVSPAVTTSYSVVAHDANGCTVPAQTIIVNVNPPLNGTATGPDSVCNGSAAILNSTARGGNGGPYTYTWNEGSVGNNISIHPTANASYTVTITDNCGTPPVVMNVPVSVLPNPVANFTPNPITGCQPLTVNFNDRSSMIGSQYYWSFGDGTSATDKNPVHVFVTPGNYTVNHIITTPQGCTGRIIIPAVVRVDPVPVSSFSTEPEVASILLPVISFDDASTNASILSWDFGDGTTPGIGINPEHAYQDTGTYTVMLVSTSDKGCVDTSYNKIRIKGEFAVYIPNAFTPNNDNTNERFTALGIGVRDFNMKIFDRWGLNIYESNDINKGWDGTVQNTLVACQMDVYVYVIELNDIQGKNHKYFGHVNLIR